ncbi:hypothetical protein DPEC_G00240740 [Dallia pectoralis]|uniref:Uncharacterized protein n=1 Tax=Dallia pectoralis TaxID=75939 RepID=A0ACC2FZS9_DALPE|nr:hypothetical protein DPEC_G00240740 [Dallia pectoralis]
MLQGADSALRSIELKQQDTAKVLEHKQADNRLALGQNILSRTTFNEAQGIPRHPSCSRINRLVKCHRKILARSKHAQFRSVYKPTST